MQLKWSKISVSVGDWWAVLQNVYSGGRKPVDRWQVTGKSWNYPYFADSLLAVPLLLSQTLPPPHLPSFGLQEINEAISAVDPKGKFVLVFLSGYIFIICSHCLSKDLFACNFHDGGGPWRWLNPKLKTNLNLKRKLKNSLVSSLWHTCKRTCSFEKLRA